MSINLNGFAVILYSGMLIIAGSIWVLCSQVRRLADLMEVRTEAAPTAGGAAARGRIASSDAIPHRVMRRNATSRVRGVSRVSASSVRRP